MKMLSTPEEQVAALGNEQLASEHFDQESDLNELIELVNLLRERLDGWDTLSAADKRKLLGEREDVLRHGDRLASEPANGGSPLLARARTEITSAWREVRQQLERLQ
jgi:hypothetical protein